MDIRYSVALLSIAVGGMLAVLGVMGAAFLLKGNVEFGLGCGGLGGVGLLMIVFGLRLRRRAIAESPELRQRLANQGHQFTSTYTAAAKPSFIKRKEAEKDQAEPPSGAAPPAARLARRRPAKPRRAHLVYWLIAGAFVLGLLGLMVAVFDFRNAKEARYGLIVVALLLVVFTPLWGRRSRYGGHGMYGDNGTYDSSSADTSSGGDGGGGDGGGD